MSPSPIRGLDSDRWPDVLAGLYFSPHVETLLTTRGWNQWKRAVSAAPGVVKKTNAVRIFRMDPLLLADVLEPVLNAVEKDDPNLLDAVNLSAEALAALGAVILDRNGQLADGVTDERAVIAALNTHAHTLMRAGRLDDVVEALQLAQRIAQLSQTQHPRTA